MAVYSHPKFKEMEMLGLKNTIEMTAAYNVYMDLCEVKQWWNVDLHPCSDLDLLFISGHASRHTIRELVLPVPLGYNLTPQHLQELFNKLQLEDYNSEGITLAMMDTDSTIVYYKITNGLVPPESPEVTMFQKQQTIDRIRKRKNDISVSVNVFKEKRRRNSYQTENKLDEPENSESIMQQFEIESCELTKPSADTRSDSSDFIGEL